ncbi:hypothetical protein AB0H03_06885 [Streptomyces sparsogenes]|uniref:hypothetical protein n=1 Tax=Streptomyces sparsogenes TaxID=67365 RepID=UPI003400C1B6
MTGPSEHTPACYCCRKTGPELRRKYVPGASGPGWIRYACEVCAGLPPDPELMPAVVAEVLAMRAARLGRAS